ncbi:hypothetical protein MRB53_002264 [Persea americana]|uniref:Uncharacterized protein n=1 Tax=Persea americana TaxID=3435 RepID=A0ACC2MU02_PERAE|nr:hypothetical protein MRB53_002264 [Persea americana]
MVKHVQDILADSEKGGLDITDAKAFVDEVITLGNKWTETKSFPNDDFFNEMFLKPSSEDQHHLDREVTEARQRLKLLEEHAAAKWAATLKARDRERTLIRQVEEVKSNLRRKTQEYEQWQILWEELPRAEDGS